MTTNEFPELERYRVQSLPQGIYYISRFLTLEEERSLLDKVLFFGLFDG